MKKRQVSKEAGKEEQRKKLKLKKAVNKLFKARIFMRGSKSIRLN